MTRYIIALGLTACTLLTYGQNRTDHPFQIQINLSGMALNAMGESLTQRDVLNIEVKDYAMPGLSVGYHVGAKLYVGYSFHPNRNFIINENYSFTNGADDILINLDYNSGTFHVLEARISPFPFGLYASAFYTHVSQARYDLSGVPLNESYRIGEAVYNDALNAAWNFNDLHTLGLGLGYNQVFNNGLSFNLGLGLPLRFAEDIYDDVVVIQSDEAFTEEDVDLIADRLSNEDFYFPVQFYLSIGKNF